MVSTASTIEPNQIHTPVNTPIESQPTNTAHNSISIQQASYIKAQQAQQYIGQRQTVCGTVAQYKKFSKGVYLNFDKPYPHATFTVVIWDNKSHISDQLRNIEQQNLCVHGEVQEYKGKPQIILNSTNQIVQ